MSCQSYGLCYLRGSTPHPLPVRRVDVDARLIDLCGEVRIRQTYALSLLDCVDSFLLAHFASAAVTPLELVYRFPLDENSAVSSFSSELDGVEVRGQVKAKEAARAEYAAAVSAGQSALLLEQRAENIFECRVGQLRAGSVCIVSIGYCTLLDAEGRSVRFVLPSCIAPRYTPLPLPASPVSPAPVNGVHSGFSCDACRISPIIGPRFHCQSCPDYDLCAACEARSPSPHPASHPLLKLVLPQSPAVPLDAASINLSKGQPARAAVIHAGVRCDGCGSSPIVGARYHCSVCADWDQCEACEAAGKHTAAHPLIKMTVAAEASNESSPALGLPMDGVESLWHQRLERAMSLPRSVAVTVSIQTPSPLLSVTSPSHPDSVTVQRQGEQASTLRFESPEGSSLLADFIVLVEQQRCFEPRAMLELDAETRTASVSLAFIPPPLPPSQAPELQAELVFLLDRSGSMSGASMRAMKEAMQLILRSLPLRCRFQLIGFGSTFAALFPFGPADYDQQSLQSARHYLDDMQANLGGTEIAAPLRAALSGTAALSSHPRQVFLLTDGQVSNAAELVSMVRKQAASVRLFTLGIGTEVDRSLCKRLARAGNGLCEFVSADASGRMDAADGGLQAKVMRQLSRAMQPQLTGVKVDWTGLQPSPARDGPQAFTQCPTVAPALFAGSRYCLFALNVAVPASLFDSASAAEPLQQVVRLCAVDNRPGSEGQQLNLSVAVGSSNVCRGSVIRRLAARALIAELEDADADCSGGGAVDARIRSIALQHGLSSRCTSFVIVYPKEQRQEREVDCIQPVVGPQSSPGGVRAGVLCQAVKCSAAPAVSGFASFTARSFEQQRSAPQFSAMQRIRTAAGSMFGLSAAAPSRDARESSPVCSPAAPSPFAVYAPTPSASWGGFGAPACALGQPVRELQSCPSPQPDELQQLVCWQQFNGSWSLEPQLVRLANRIRAKQAKAAGQDVRDWTTDGLHGVGQRVGISDAAIAVLLALACLRCAFAAREADWKLMAEKGRYFLSHTEKVADELQQRLWQEMDQLGRLDSAQSQQPTLFCF